MTCEHWWLPVEFVAWERSTNEPLVLVCLKCDSYTERVMSRLHDEEN